MVKRLRHRPFTAVTGVRFPYGSPRRSKVRFAPFFFAEKRPPASLLLLFRKRSRSRRLFACKRAYNAFGSLPTFCGCAPDGVGFFLLLLFRKRSRSRRLFACNRAYNAFGSLPTFCGMRLTSRLRYLHHFLLRKNFYCFCQISLIGIITCVINLSFSLCWGGPSRKAKRHLSKICILFFSAYLTSFSTTSGSFSYAP